MSAGLIWAGQTVGLIHDIPSCAELIERMVSDCRAHLGRAVALAATSPSPIAAAA
jgi:nitronate monooxygenase